MLIASLVSTLLTPSSPRAIIRAISCVIVFSLQCQSIRLDSHIGVEVGKVLPAVTNLNASSSIIVVSNVFGIVAPFEHITPTHPFSRMRFSVFNGPVVTAAHATARSGITRNHGTVNDSNLFSTIAPTKASTFRFGCFSRRDNSEPCESGSNWDSFLGRHGIGDSMLCLTGWRPAITGAHPI